MDDAEEKEERLKKVPKGTRIGEKYLVLDVLGAGEMGVVYRCLHELIDKEVAIKLLLSSDPAIILRFGWEAKRTAALRILAELGSGDAAAWKGVKQARGPRRPVFMTRIGSHYRLLFRYNDSTLEILDLVPRQGLDVALKRLRTSLEQIFYS